MGLGALAGGGGASGAMRMWLEKWWVREELTAIVVMYAWIIFNYHKSIFNIQYSIFNYHKSIFNIYYSIINIQYLISNNQCSIFTI